MNETVDNGPNPYVLPIEQATLENDNYRTTLWTGKNLQLTVMSIEVGGDIGLEVHNDNDQFLRIESGSARFEFGPSASELSSKEAAADDGIFIPVGTWHNLVNTGDTPLKLYSIYAPSHHPHGTIHQTRAEADAAEEAEHNA